MATRDSPAPRSSTGDDHHAPGGAGRFAPPTAGRPAQEKAAWRARLLDGRRAMPAAALAAARDALRDHVLQLADTLSAGPVCAYLPIGREPGSPALLDALVDAGRTVLLPVVPPRPGPLNWAPYAGPEALGPGPLGLREPTTARWDPRALADAPLVLVPALAVDRSGVRLGRGGGYYDRSLALAAAGAELTALLYDGELVDRLPAEPFDRRVTGAVLPTGGHIRLGRPGPAGEAPGGGRPMTR